MAERSGPIIQSPADIRGLTATFNATGAHFAVIRGKEGYITAAAGAKIAFMSRWIIRQAGTAPDGKPRFRLRAQFSWTNEPFMAMVGRGELRGRVIIQMLTKRGKEDVDILGWSEWKLEGGVLTLEDIYQTEGTVKWRPVATK